MSYHDRHNRIGQSSNNLGEFFFIMENINIDVKVVQPKSIQRDIMKRKRKMELGKK